MIIRSPRSKADDPTTTFYSVRRIMNSLYGRDTITDTALEKRYFRLFLLTLLVICFGQLFFVFAYGYSATILDAFGFRQSQTALSAYWIEHGGPAILYETPVIGAPWAIQFEFPFYQWIVAALQRLSGIPMDQSGRIVCLFFFVLTLFPLKRIVRYVYDDDNAFLVVAILLLGSPLYLFWSRTFMIESVALFSSVMFIDCVIRWIQTRSAVALAGTFVFGSIAALQKVTTFVPAAVVACLFVLVAIFGETSDRQRRRFSFAQLIRSFLRYSPLALSVIAALVILTIWVKISDHVKELNPIGRNPTSAALGAWNFGTWSMRTSAAFWKVVVNRMLPEALGPVTGVAAVAGAAFALQPRWAGRAALVASGFLGGILIFTTLNFVHNYYQYSISIYLIMVAGFAIYEISVHRAWLAAVAVLVLLAGQESIFYLGNDETDYYQLLKAGTELQHGRTMQIADYVEANTAENSVVIGFGFDWSSELPYYAHRRGLMLPNWIVDDRLTAVLDKPTQPIGGLPVGAIVICPTTMPAAQAALLAGNATLANALTQMKKTTISDCDVYLP